MTEETNEEKKGTPEEQALAEWDAKSVEEKIQTIANNAISRQEALQRMEHILEKVQTIAVRLENLELKQKLQVVDGGEE